MSNRIIRRADATDDRRTSNRLPIEREVRYKVLGGKKTIKQVGMGKTVNMSSGGVLFTTETALPEIGMGKTVNMSSGGVLFTTETALPEGERVELAVSWPAQLNA